MSRSIHARFRKQAGSLLQAASCFTLLLACSASSNGDGQGGATGYGGKASSGGASNGQGGAQRGGTSNANGGVQQTNGGTQANGGSAQGGASNSNGGSMAGGTNGGVVNSGGTNAAGTSAAGTNAGGSSMGGKSNGGSTNGGTANGGGTSAGGASNGGAAQGGNQARGGSGQGGAANGGTANGGSGNGGASGGKSSGGATGSGGSSHTGVWRIMPLGDSITGTTCYPQLLSQKLKNAGHTNFQFMGTNTNNQSCTDGAISNAPNVVTEGHGGYIVSCLTGDFNNCASKGSTSELATWMAARPAADVVLMHFGTNDVWNSIATATITGAYTKVLSSIRQANPNTIVFVAQILPMHPDGCTDSTSSCPNNGVKTLNAAIPAWASAQSTTASPIYVVNIYASVGDETAYVPNSTLTTDGVHPNPKGSGLVADAWMSALVGKGIP